MSGRAVDKLVATATAVAPQIPKVAEGARATCETCGEGYTLPIGARGDALKVCFPCFAEKSCKLTDADKAIVAATLQKLKVGGA